MGTDEELVLVDRLVRMCSSGDADARRACDVLRELAMRWHEADIWAKALSICPQGTVLQTIGVEGFVRAYKKFTSKFFQATKS